jgi:hypothetical protein
MTTGDVGVAPSPADDADSRQRRDYVLGVVAEIVTVAAGQGRRYVVVVDGAGEAGRFADGLADAMRDSGTPCARLSHARPYADEDAWRATDDGRGPVLADGPRWSEQPPAGRWDIRVFLRTPAPTDGPGDYGADIVIDYDEPSWPVIKYVAADLEHPAERLHVTETRAFFGPRAATWNLKFGDDHEAYEAAVAESGIPAGSVIIDVGCGTGRALPALVRASGTGTVIGIDLTPQMLAAAANQPTNGHRLVMADAHRLPLGSASVDVVFAAGLVPHLPDPARGLAELARVTRVGGRLILFHPSGRAALAARHGRALAPDEPLDEHRLEPLLDASGWHLTSYDDPAHRFYARAVRG